MYINNQAIEIPNDIVAKHIFPQCGIKEAMYLAKTCKQYAATLINETKNFWERTVEAEDNQMVLNYRLINGMREYFSEFENLKKLINNYRFIKKEHYLLALENNKRNCIRSIKTSPKFNIQGIEKSISDLRSEFEGFKNFWNEMQYERIKNVTSCCWAAFLDSLFLSFALIMLIYNSLIKNLAEQLYLVCDDSGPSFFKLETLPYIIVVIEGIWLFLVRCISKSCSTKINLDLDLKKISLSARFGCKIAVFTLMSILCAISLYIMWVWQDNKRLDNINHSSLITRYITGFNGFLSGPVLKKLYCSTLSVGKSLYPF